MLWDSLINILSRENAEGYHHGHIGEVFLREHVNDFSGQFYLCGPPEMMKAMTEMLSGMGIDRKSVTMDL